MTTGNLRSFNIDAGASLFTVQAFASGIASVVAHSPKFAIRDIVGHAQFVPDTMQQASVNLNIASASLEIMGEVTRADRREIERIMFDEILEKARYPKIEYKSSHVTVSKTAEGTYRLSIVGELSLHGTVRGISFEANVVPGEETLRAQGSFVIFQSDYGLPLATVAGGSIKLKDELKFSYFILLRRQN